MPYSMQLTEQIPNDPPRITAKTTTSSNHPSTPNQQHIHPIGAMHYSTVQIATIASTLYFPGDLLTLCWPGHRCSRGHPIASS